jgi:prolyl-tRNA synthetase
LNSVKQIGITAKKNENFSDWYTQVVLKTDLVDYSPVTGFIVLRPYGYAIWENIRSLLDKRFKETGHQNAFLPLLIPENLLAKERTHFAGFTPEVYWVTKAGDRNLSEKLAVRPTSETLAYSVFSKWISSYRDLPLKLNFWNSALRAEIKGTKPFIRNSEFLWQEGHTVHSTREDAIKEATLILEIYHELIESSLAVPCIKGLKSEKEKFVGAEYTVTLEGLMADGRALQLATSHNLGQNFSKAFEIKYLGKDSQEHFAWQTSWGISWRLIGALIMVHGDDRGLILPPKIAPIQVVIVPIYNEKNAGEVKPKAREVEYELKKHSINVTVDDRDEYTSGWKFNDWETKGIPLRINIGPRDISKSQAELVRRDTMEKMIVGLEKVSEFTISVLQQIQENLLCQAKKFLSENITKTDDYHSLKLIIDRKGGLILTSWCEEQNCEAKMKEEIGAEIRVIPFEEQNELSYKECIYCRRPAKKMVMIAKGY